MKLTGSKLLKSNYKTMIIDLTLTDTEILQKTDKHSVRKNISRSEKRGVIIKNITNDSTTLYEYAKMLYAGRIKLGIEHRTLIQIHDEILQLTTDNNYALFMAYWNDIPIGAMGSKVTDKRITEQGLTRTQLNDEQKLYCVELLRWNIILYGKKIGCTEYDLGGLSMATPKEMNISRNKTKWNGSIITLSRYA